MKILITWAAGFIGMHVAKLLLERGNIVANIDNLNDYHDPRLKLACLEQLKPFANFRFVQADKPTGWPLMTSSQRIISTESSTLLRRRVGSAGHVTSAVLEGRAIDVFNHGKM